MASNDPQSPTPRPPGDPESTDQDALRRLERRLDRASEAAERLIAEATARAAESKPPPAGWQRRETGPEGNHGAGAEGNHGVGADGNRGAGVAGEVDLLLQVLSSLRDWIPPELQRRLGEAVREVLLALRALIDWYLERSERQRAEPVEVQDIPIM